MLDAHAHAALLDMAGRPVCTVLMMQACSTDSIVLALYLHALMKLCCHAVLNNTATQHFQKLAAHVMALLERLEKQQQPSQQAVNAVYFLRLIVKHLTENLSAAQLVGFVNGEVLAIGSAESHAGAVSVGASLLLISQSPLPCEALGVCEWRVASMWLSRGCDSRCSSFDQPSFSQSQVKC